MKIRRSRGQAVPEFLLTMVVVFGMLLLVVGVSSMWNMRNLAIYAAIDSTCKEQMAPGYGTSNASKIVNNVWPGQDIHATTSDPVWSKPDEPIFLNVQGTYVFGYLLDAFGKFLPNSAFVYGTAGCPAQKFNPQPW